MSEFDLNVLVKRGLGWEERDPHVIAHRLVPMIPAELRDAVLADVLTHKVREALRFERAKGSEMSERVEGHSRWTRHAPTIRERYRTLDGWKFYDELTSDDCEGLADEYEARAAANESQARRFRQLAMDLRANGARTVADLNRMDLAA